MVKITNAVLLCIKNTMGKFDYETGGLLGEIDNVISVYEFDQGVIQKDCNTYYPNTVRLNKILDRWHNQKIKFTGIIHSHRNTENLSYADINFAQQIIAFNSMSQIFMPIYIINKQTLTFNIVFDNGNIINNINYVLLNI